MSVIEKLCGALDEREIQYKRFPPTDCEVESVVWSNGCGEHFSVTASGDSEKPYAVTMRSKLNLSYLLGAN